MGYFLYTQKAQLRCALSSLLAKGITIRDILGLEITITCLRMIELWIYLSVIGEQTVDTVNILVHRISHNLDYEC